MQDPAWRQHAEFLNTGWAGLEEHQLSKVRAWSRAHLPARRPVTFYFFSGPDFLYADAFFPGSATYILAGLEPIGQLPDVLALRTRSLASDLESVRISISTLVSRSYFITSYMGSDLRASQLRGTLPILFVFLARTGKTIHDVSFVAVGPDGSLLEESEAKSAAHGVKIVFSGPEQKKQTLYYFKTDLSNKGVQSSGFLEFCRRLGIGDIFIKAASYLLHTGPFSTVRDFLLAQGAAVVQDDTGIPLKYFEQHGWQVQPFGRYVGPIAVFRGNFQSKLKTLFDKSAAPPIEFGIGYRWRTNQSHVLLARNPNPQILPPQAVTRPEATGQAKPAPDRDTSSIIPSPPSAGTEKITSQKAAQEKTAPSAPAMQPGMTSKTTAPPPAPIALEASRFTTWPSLLFGGLFSAALVSVFGLEGLASAVGLLLQIAVIGGIVWGVMTYVRKRKQQPALAGTGSAVEDSGSTAQWPATERPDRQGADRSGTQSRLSGLAARLRRWS